MKDNSRVTILINEMEKAIAQLKMEWATNTAISISALSALKVSVEKLNKEVFK